MRTRTALPAAVLLLAASAGCASTGSSVNTTAASSAPSVTPVASSPSKPAAKPAQVGDSVGVTGFGGEKLTVQLVKVFPDAKGADEFTSPDSGKQFYAVQLRITNAGSKAYSDSPDNCVVLRDTSGQQFQSDLSNVTAGQSFGSVNLAAGDSVLGVVVFQVPVGDKPVKVQFTPDSGMADSTAQWNLS
jgi:hypothetical protein